jgi:hypothetical protein
VNLNKDVSDDNWALFYTFLSEVSSEVKVVLNGFIFQARDMVNAPNTLRKATKCISGHTTKKF